MARNVRKVPLSRTMASEAFSAPSTDISILPQRVAALRTRMIEAADTGDIENLRPAIEWNETVPIFGHGADQPKSFADAIDALKRLSFDGKGSEILTILKAVLMQPYVIITRGQIVTYLWPAFAHDSRWPDEPDARMGLLRCVRFVDLVNWRDEAPLPVQRVGIGADGTWHFFWGG